jgi:hypothetical protein
MLTPKPTEMLRIEVVKPPGWRPTDAAIAALADVLLDAARQLQQGRLAEAQAAPPATPGPRRTQPTK